MAEQLMLAALQSGRLVLPGFAWFATRSSGQCDNGGSYERGSRMRLNQRLQPKARSREPGSAAGVPKEHREPLPIDEIYPKYPHEWVVVKVTAVDEHQRISHGQVLAHSASRKKVSKALLEAHRQDPSVHTYLFVGGPRPKTVGEWRERLAEAAGKVKDYRDAWW
jgi:hypothetical protein